MMPGPRFSLCAAIAAIALLPEQAHAFRCKSKLVLDGMHEQEVVSICGAPASRRHLGHAVRSYPYGGYSFGLGGNNRLRSGHRVFSEEVVVTEYVYNFGPRKLMRRLIFEGGILVEIETLGYGYSTRTPDD